MTEAAQIIYRLLAEDAPLDALLARSVVPPGTSPAIYDRWAAPGTPVPYCVLTWSYAAGAHWAKGQAALVVDVFTVGPSAQAAQAIARRVIELLDRQQPVVPGAGTLRCYLDTEGSAPEDDPEVMHWRLAFTVVCWRGAFIAQLS